MPKLWQYLGFSQDHPHGKIGLEIETESSKLYNYVPTLNEFWQTQADGSLRQNGVEYVFRTPYSPEDQNFEDALRVFAEQVKIGKFIQSTYSSVHVHLNMLDKDLTKVMNFICLYFLAEETLAEYCGNDRNGNLFCLKSTNAELIPRTAKEIAEAIEEGNGVSYIKQLNNGLLKYSGLNLVPLRTFGSLEVRLHQGCTDVNLIRRWVNILMCLYNAVDRFADPVEIVNSFHNRPRQFLTDLFGTFSAYLNFVDIEEKTKNGLWYVTSVAAAVDNWKTFGNKKATDSPRRTIKKPGNRDHLVTYYQMIEQATTDLNARINARNALRNIVIEDF